VTHRGAMTVADINAAERLDKLRPGVLKMTQLEIEWRDKNQGVEVLGVSFPERQIEVVVMPYETETRVLHRGRWIREIVARGAFQAINADKRRITVNRGHVADAAVGKAVALHPSRDEGLVAVVGPQHVVAFPLQ